MTYWIIGGNGQTFGPVDLATIHRWVAERRVISTTPVCQSATGRWRDAALFPEFASAFGAEPMPDVAPAGDAPRTAPPTGPSPNASAVPANWPPDMIAIPQLISGIFNIIAAAGWAFTCFGIILSIPLTILGVVMMGTMVGSVLPLLFRSVGLDPALMSNPFVSAIVDVVGIVLYTTIAVLLLD